MGQLDEIWAKYTNGFPDEDARQLNLRRVPKMLPGTAAFPVSAGVIRKRGSEESSQFPTHGVMFVGYDPDSVGNYDERTKSGFSNGDREQPNLMRYWRGVYGLLKLTKTRGASLSESECFFTNVYPALREGTKNWGGSRVATSEFLSWCLKFLGTQAHITVPRLVVVFGRKAFKCVGLRGNESPSACVRDTLIGKENANGVQNVPVVALDHPTLWLSSTEEVRNRNADRLQEALTRASLYLGRN